MTARPEWKRGWEPIRLAVLERDHYLCQPCLRAGRFTPANQVDHKVPRSQGGLTVMKNMEGICSGEGTPMCHEEKSKREANPNYKERVQIGVDGWPVPGVGSP